MKITKEQAQSLLAHTKQRREKELSNFKEAMKGQLETWCNSANDLENIATSALRVATTIARLEGEIQQLENFIFYID